MGYLYLISREIVYKTYYIYFLRTSPLISDILNSLQIRFNVGRSLIDPSIFLYISVFCTALNNFIWLGTLSLSRVINLKASLEKSGKINKGISYLIYLKFRSFSLLSLKLCELCNCYIKQIAFWIQTARKFCR